MERYKTGASTISEIDCITGTALISNPCKKDYNILIGKAISKMFFMHGKQYHQDTVLNYLEAIIDTYNYETPETILSFFHKAGKGDFGKFYGDPDIGTIREWFSEYLGNVIVPARERLRTTEKETYDNQRDQGKSLREHIEGSGKNTPVTYEKNFKEGKQRNL